VGVARVEGAISLKGGVFAGVDSLDAMEHPPAPERKVVLETDRLQLRPWHVSEAVILHELWTERDPRVPPHRRIDAEGRPTVADLEDRIRSRSYANALGLLVAGRKSSGDVIGYCGLTENTKVPEGGNWRSSSFAGPGGRGMRPRPRWPSSAGPRQRATGICGPPSVTGTPLLAAYWRNSGSSRPTASSPAKATGTCCSPRSNCDRRVGG
jgi:hypothetical protein